MSSMDTIPRSILPIPDPQHVGVTTYDARDPGTKFPPILRMMPAVLRASTRSSTSASERFNSSAITL